MNVHTCRLSFALLIVIIICTIVNISTANTYTTILLNAISKETPNVNVVFSTFSIRAAFSLLYSGIDGPAANELEKFFEFPSDKLENANYFQELFQSAQQSKGITMQIANRIYVAEKFPILDSYNKLTQEYFSSEAQTVDFRNSATVKEINDWVATITADKIKNLFKEGDFDEFTKLVLVNAIYFKGNWFKPFDPKKTTKRNFFVTKTKIVQVDMMSQYNRFEIGSSKKLDAEIISLPFADRQYKMLIILPNLNGLDGIEALRNLVTNLKDTCILGLTKTLRLGKVEVRLPKFEVKLNIKLANILKKIGVSQIFKFDGANYSKLTSSKESLAVSKVVHEAYLKVDEEGAEGAAATGIEIVTKSFADNHFEVNHPFVYAIISSEAVFFAGYILDF